jgi:serine protease inhibitor
MKKFKNWIKTNIFYIVLVIFFYGIFTFFAYYNFNWFPEKERKMFTLKIYYQSGRIDVQTFDLPKSTHFSLIMNSRRKILYIYFFRFQLH